MASRNLGTLTIDLVAQIAGFVAGMDKAQKVAEERSKRIEASIKNAAHAIEGALVAFGVEKLVHGIIEASTAQEKALAQLEARLKSTGGASGKSKEQLVALANALQDTTTFSHETALSAEALLLSFQNVRGEMVDKTLKAAADLATALGTDLPEATRQLGFALNNPITGLTRLRRAGISLTADQTNLIKRLAETGNVIGAQKAILEAVEKAYGGAAEAATNTLGGAFKQLQNAAHDLMEAPEGSLGGVTKAVKDLVAFLKEPATIEAAQAFSTAIVSGFKFAAQAVYDFLDLTGNVLSTKQDAYIERQKLKIKDLQNDADNIQKQGRSTGLFGVMLFGGETQEQFEARVTEAKAKVVDATKNLEVFEAAVKRSRSGVPFGQGTIPKPVPPAAPPEVVAVPDSASYQKLSAAYREQLDSVGKLTEGLKLRFKIESGELKDATPKEVEMLKIWAAQVDAHDALEATTKKQAEAQKKLNDEYETERLHLLEQSQIIGQVSELEKTRFDTTYGRLKDISAARKTELLDLAAEANANDLIAKEQEKRKDAAKKQAEATKEFYLQAQRNLQDIFASSLVDAFEGKKTNLLRSFKDMLLKMAAQAASAKILDALFSSFSTTSGIGKFFSGFFQPPARAAGGPVEAGKLYQVGEHGTEWIVAPSDGYVIPHGAAAAAAAPAGGALNVQIINPPSEPTVTESRDANGVRNLQIMFDKMFQSGVADGRYDGVFKGRFGVNPAANGRR